MASIDFRAAAVVVPDHAGQGGDDRVLLSPTTLSLTEQRIAIIGSNGSGKSTLARLINGLVTPTSGSVTVDGLDVLRQGRRVRQQVGFCFTDPSAQMVMPTCVEDVELSLRQTIRDRSSRRQAALEVLERFGLREQADQSVHTLSGGQRQMLALAGVLASGPAILIADEPTTLLDLRNSRTVGETLLALEQQLVLVTHDLELAARCDRALLVEDGRVTFDGDAAEAVATYVSSVARP
ncbi:energy-coupling factor ABC transporter ATP-binding protein [Nocardioides sp. Kera G14]|uniref:energy-coupling factor ABC transporter ATP-binding protein n=1 Tax=Nocardioides sp. Kera G14 TaxID=2884264 RepID=UPI001D1168FB|nr:ABC transporter ATP-binding protein [Nocardioides sp. Kera G14]UDY22709.1 energy-coupling factor ABC transporter ATP-binding protein [Nocardioides sp. Kera G14]